MGTSSIQGSVTAHGDVDARVTSGSLAIAGNQLDAVTAILQPASGYTTGTCPLDLGPTPGCSPEATGTDVLVISIKLPAAATDTAQVTIEEQSADSSKLAPARIHSGDLDVTREDPARLELRLDASHVGGLTKATAEVAVGSDGTYKNLGDCAAGAVPAPPEDASTETRAGSRTTATW